MMLKRRADGRYECDECGTIGDKLDMIQHLCSYETAIVEPNEREIKRGDIRPGNSANGRTRNSGGTERASKDK